MRGSIRTFFPFVVLCAVLAVAGATVAVADKRESMYVALIGLAVVAAVSLVWPRQPVAAAAIGVAVAAYAGAEVWAVWPVAAANAAPIAVQFLFTLLTLAAVAAVACVAGRAIRGQMDEVRYRDIVIKELTKRDPETSAFKPQYAMRMLQEEIERARRYRRPLALVVLSIDDWEGLVRQRGDADMRRSLARVSEISLDSLRLMDKICRRNTSQFALILPETPLAGAQIVAGRIIRQAEAELGFNIRAGVVEFPADGDDAEALAREADSAAALASSIGLPMASRGLLAR
jgi:diguanylate cyclase (GGDEF)-like protein